MQALVYAKAHEAEDRLTSLGLTAAVLQEAARAGKLARSTATPFHPAVYAGFLLYADTLASLGELLTTAKDDWIRDDPAGHPLVISHQRKLALTVATSDANTGNGDVENPPNTRPAKGIRTQEAVIENQGLLFPDMFDEQRPRHDLMGYEFWWLLMHIDEQRNELRLELSRGTRLNRDRAIVGWSERIMLASQPLDEGTIPVIGDPNGDGPQLEHFDVNVRKLG